MDILPTILRGNLETKKPNGHDRNCSRIETRRGRPDAAHPPNRTPRVHMYTSGNLLHVRV